MATVSERGAARDSDERLRDGDFRGNKFNSRQTKLQEFRGFGFL